MKNLFIFIFTLILTGSCTNEEPVLKVSLVADPQYAHQPDAGRRLYKESLWKLEEAIDTFNSYHVDVVQNLGDIIDGGWENFDSILPVYEKLHSGIENYHLLGNHDFSVDSVHLPDLTKKLSMPDYYYSYSRNGWRFIVLDATDYAYYSNALHSRDTSRIDFYFQKIKGQPNRQLWNGAIGKEQQNWLKQELDSADYLGQKVILFSHLPVRPPGNSHNLWNDGEITELIESGDNVVAFLNGHNHAGNYEFKNGVHYITLSGMVNTKISSYGILKLYNDSLVLKGYGNQKTLHLKNRQPGRP